ncbi:MAG: SLC13 family permease [Planctomycetales bacterium]|nr:SLC13 family permease [Planctomycetales bacterium]
MPCSPVKRLFRGLVLRKGLAIGIWTLLGAAMWAIPAAAQPPAPSPESAAVQTAAPAATTPPLGYHKWIAIAATVLVFVGMQRRGVPIELLFLSGLVLVTLTGVISPEVALAGFSSKAVVMIGALFAASAGLRTTGALDWIGQRLLGAAETERAALWRLTATIVPISAFVLNTPLVAMSAPVVVDWCRRRSVSPSRLLLPLSYLTILGGVCTLIGTSTTLVINSRLDLLDTSEYAPEVAERVGELTFFEITPVGVPLALIGGTYLLFVAPRLLPDRRELIEQFGDRRREYLVEMQVQGHCPLAGKSVEEAGLRNLPGLFLIEIDRRGEIITPVTPQDQIAVGDHLVFTGVVATIADLERIAGLVPAADQSFEAEPAIRIRRQLTEAVISRTSPLVGLTVREAEFRKRYNAAIVAVHRNGERLTNKIGSIRLEPGDTLLLQTKAEFVENFRNSRDFYLVSRVGPPTARRHDRALLAMGLFALLIVWLTTCSVAPGLFPWGSFTKNNIHAIAAMSIVLAMVATRCLTSSEARAAIDLQLLLTVGAALGLGEALHTSGAAAWLAEILVGSAHRLALPIHLQPYVLLAVVYITSQIFTEMITNVAVATIMITVAIDVANVGHYDPRPFIIAVTMAASLSFATPIGYQTNLMVMGPGGYRPPDYLRVGLPLAILMTVASMLIIPMFWPF